MGNRANFVIVKDQDWRLYYSHWGGCRMLDALIGGPELALRYAASLRRCEKNEWCDPTWADGGLVDLDRRRVLFFGEPLMVEMNAAARPYGGARHGVARLRDLLGIRRHSRTGGIRGGSPSPRYVGQAADEARRARNRLCHLISVVDADGQLRFWPLWWHLSKAWHGPTSLDTLPGPGIRRIRLGRFPKAAPHRCASKDVGDLANSRHDGVSPSSTRARPGWHTEVWEDRYEEHVKRCDGALRVPELDVVAGIESAEAWIRKRVFESFEDSPRGADRQTRGNACASRAGLRRQPRCRGRVCRAPNQRRVVTLPQRV